MKRKKPAITEDEYREIQQHVSICAKRVAKNVKYEYIDSDDLEQDYYTWLLFKKKGHNPSYTIHRMIDIIRRYTHYNRITKSTRLKKVRIDSDDDHYKDLFANKPDTSTNEMDTQEENDHARAIIHRLQLPPRHKLLLKLLYVNDKSQHDAANIMGYSPARISQLHAQCRPILRRYFQKGKL